MNNSIRVFQLLLLIFIVSCKNSVLDINKYRIKNPDLINITLQDNFWKPIIKINREITIPYAFGKCEETGRIENFAIAGGFKKGKHIGERYNDTDVYKIIEGACYSLMQYPDPELETYVDNLISLIASAQETDGYLYTSRTINPDIEIPGSGSEKWSFVWISHELYNAGHMYEAAVAHYKATGKDSFLQIAKKNAELIIKTFGPGKNEMAPGHQEIEIGLVKLFQVTGDQRYLKQAKYFLEQRGKKLERKSFPEGDRFEIYNKDYYLQNHKPVKEQREAVGHAVRATYLFSGMTDVGVLGRDTRMLDASVNLWRNVTGAKLYLTGGIGASHSGEAFGENFVLPNADAYNETCAAIGNVFWNNRLFKALGDADYYDVLERTLYNGLISGISLSGKEFFYPNPLESSGKIQRSPWFGVACCPGNITRFLASMPEYIYAFDEKTFYVNLFVASSADVFMNDQNLNIVQKTNYPWDGNVGVNIYPETENEFILAIRLPNWTAKNPLPGSLYKFTDLTKESVKILVNGKHHQTFKNKGYICLKKKWKYGDRVDVILPMPVRLVKSRAEVIENKGKLAVSRGPIVYCAEEIDNDFDISVCRIPENPEFSVIYEKDLLGGITTVSTDVFIKQNGIDVMKKLKMIPYFRWANRTPGKMIIWIKSL